MDLVNPEKYEYTYPEERLLKKSMYEVRTRTDDSDWSDWRDPADHGAGISVSSIPEILLYPNTVSVTICKDIGLGNRLWTEYRIKGEHDE